MFPFPGVPWFPKGKAFVLPLTGELLGKRLLVRKALITSSLKDEDRATPPLIDIRGTRTPGGKGTK